MPIIHECHTIEAQHRKHMLKYSCLKKGPMLTVEPKALENMQMVSRWLSVHLDSTNVCFATDIAALKQSSSQCAHLLPFKACVVCRYEA